MNSRAGHQAHTQEQKIKTPATVALEGLLRKQEKESNYVDMESWIWESLLNYMGSAKEVTLLDTPSFKVQAAVNMMALASRSEGIIQKSGTISSLREVFSWKLKFAIQTEGNKRQQKERVTRLETPPKARNLHQRALKKLPKPLKPAARTQEYRVGPS